MPKDNERLRGMGGWLMFLTLILIVNVLFYLYDAFSALVVLVEFPIFLLSVFIELGIIVSFTISIIYLFKEDKKGVEILKYALWLPLINAVALLFITFMLDLEIDYIQRILNGIIFATIWVSYLKQSKRVKNTYYENAKMNISE